MGEGQFGMIRFGTMTEVIAAFLILTIFGLIEDIFVMDMIFQGIRGTTTMILCAKLNLIRKEIGIWIGECRCGNRGIGTIVRTMLML